MPCDACLRFLTIICLSRRRSTRWTAQPSCASRPRSLASPSSRSSRSLGLATPPKSVRLVAKSTLKAARRELRVDDRWCSSSPRRGRACSRIRERGLRVPRGALLLHAECEGRCIWLSPPLSAASQPPPWLPLRRLLAPPPPPARRHCHLCLRLRHRSRRQRPAAAAAAAAALSPLTVVLVVSL